MGIRDERFDHAAHMPHRSFAGDSRLDARLESEFGRLFFNGLVTKSEYEAGIRYANIVLLYLHSTDAPSPYGNDYINDVADEECSRRKIRMSSARTVLNDVGRRCAHVVDRIAVYDQPMRDGELCVLRVGLRALAGETEHDPLLTAQVRRQTLRPRETRI
jgi:hypothetical protein